MRYGLAGLCSGGSCQRLDISGEKFETILSGLDGVEALADPLGSVSLATRLDDGLDLYRVSCPIGVICVIFEARPEAAVRSLACYEPALSSSRECRPLHPHRQLVIVVDGPRTGANCSVVGEVRKRRDFKGR